MSTHRIDASGLDDLIIDHERAAKIHRAALTAAQSIKARLLLTGKISPCAIQSSEDVTANTPIGEEGRASGL